MTEVCVIGDSHVGALRRAMRDLIIPKPAENLTYFGAWGELWKQMRLQGSTLVTDDGEFRAALAASSGGPTSIELDHYDQFVIIGLAFGLRYMVGLYRAHCCDSIPDPTGNKYRLSDNCFIAAVEGSEMLTQSMRIAQLIRSVSDKPVTVVPMPNPAIGVPESDLPKWTAPFHQAVRNGDADAIGGLFRILCDRLSRDLDIRIIPPPAEAAENGVFNRRELSELPADLASLPVEHRIAAMYHGNARYGAILARQLFAIPPDR